MTCPCVAYVPMVPPCPTPIHCLACGAVWVDGKQKPAAEKAKSG